METLEFLTRNALRLTFVIPNKSCLFFSLGSAFILAHTHIQKGRFVGRDQA